MHSQNYSAILPRILFTNDWHKPDLHFRDILRFFSIHISKLMQRFFLIRLRQILLKSGA